MVPNHPKPVRFSFEARHAAEDFAIPELAQQLRLDGLEELTIRTIVSPKLDEHELPARLHDQRVERLGRIAMEDFHRFSRAPHASSAGAARVCSLKRTPR